MRPTWGPNSSHHVGGKSTGGKEITVIKSGGLGKGLTGTRRHRRLGRRGGVKRISAMIYPEVRAALKNRLEVLIRDCVIFVEHSKRKTVTVSDVIFALKRLGNPIYGFDPDVTKSLARPKARVAARR
ncbi:hypothetical protein MMC26_006861 [Xylographa opegraphella]|nr:hypothetical protein [Xylographa opegraphella]